LKTFKKTKNTMKRFLGVAFALLTVISLMGQTRKNTSASSGNDPDFAFPEKVEQTALQNLDAALKRSDGVAVVNALVRYGLAKGGVSTDSLVTVFAKISEVEAKCEAPGVKAMLNLLQARIFCDIYSRDSYKINQRTTIRGAAADDDFLRWSKEQYMDKVGALTGAALARRAELLEIPLGKYGDVILYNRNSTVFYPTLYDFVAYRALECYKVFDGSAALNPALAYAPMDAALYPKKTIGSMTSEILTTYRSLAEGRGDSAPAVIARRNMLEYILPRLFGSGMDVPVWARSGVSRGGTSDYAAFMKAYDECVSSPFAIELVLAVNVDMLSGGELTGLYALLNKFISDNPTYININKVKNMRNKIARKNVRVTVPVQVAKGLPAMISVESRNVGEVKLNVYDVTKAAGNSREPYYQMTGRWPTPLKTLTVNFDGEVPFRASKDVEITFPKYGLYVVIPEFADQQKPEKTYPVVTCSDMAMSVYDSVDDARAVATDAVTGAPLKGISFYYRPWSRAQANSMLPGATDADGVLRIKKKEPGTVEPRKGADIYAPPCGFYGMTAPASSKRLMGEVFTSLNLYHPGDKVDFAIVAYETEHGISNIAAGCSLMVKLRDANFVVVDTLRVQTDSWGRAEGSFTLPADGLTGNFTIMAGNDMHEFSRSFMVSDYKLPTFAVTVTGVARPASPGEKAVITGEALTLAGFPVEEASVRLQLQVRAGSWFRASDSPVFYETSARTDAAGKFTVEIPADVIASSPAPEGYFMAAISVTSPDGETQQTSTGFNMGKPLVLQAAIPQVYPADKPTKATVTACDNDGKEQRISLVYTVKSVHRPLYGGDDTYADVKSGSCESGDVAPLLRSLPSGEYSIRFAPADSVLADETFTRVTVYRTTDTACPVDALLWLPETILTADGNGEVEIPVGSAAESPRILMTAADINGHITDMRWLNPATGMSKVKVSLPDAKSGLRVYFRIVSRLTSASSSVKVNPASSDRAITVETETFRDKVTPGDKETIRFKVKGLCGADPESAVILDMSNKAIDLLSPNPMNLAVGGYWNVRINIDGSDFGVNDMSLSGNIKSLSWLSGVLFPEWDFYGREFVPNVFLRGRSLMKMSAMSAGGAADTMNVKDEATEEDAADAVVEEAEVYASQSADNGMALEESKAVTGSTRDGGTQDSGSVYRLSEMPLAFFRPMLQTDAEGNLEITYTVPDANTTWVLRSLAYNRSLLTAVGKTEIMASKPLMVSSNAARFLRTGDKVCLMASVMNAADSAVTAVTLCEILDYATGKVLASAESTDSIGAMGRQVVGLDFDVPSDVQGVIYRVKGSTGHFSDGEQTLIPVLPASQDIVESKMFYLAPGDNHFTMPLDAVTDGRAFLKFTENPVWEVVSALPGLRENQINSSIEAAAAIFSAAVADGLMREYPEIARTLRKWHDNPADSSLVSKLEKDETLKTILLSATPWVSDALSQTERMQRLVLLLDGRNTSRVIARGIADLAKCAVADGGWCWTAGYPKPSRWCTEHILDMLGDLNRMGWLPKDKRLAGMINKAVSYLDKETVKAFSKYPKSDYTSYCYTRIKFPSVRRSTAVTKVINATVQRAIAGWRDHSTVMKAVDAIVLNANGYNATARQILESLTQYATVTPQKGMWWQQLENMWFASMDKIGCTGLILEAYAQTDPENAAIDKIRQWLILEKTNTDWGNQIITSQVVAAILTSGRNWTVNSAGTAIRVGDTLLTPDKAEYATGSFTEQITPMLKDATTLTIDRQGNYPSVGSIVAMRHARMNEIKAVSCDELSVEKRMSVFNGSEWVPSETFGVGDRVKVTLVIKAGTDMDYVVIQDMRAAGLEPVEQLPVPIWSEGLCFYRENRDSQTNIFIDRMPRGTYILDYELFATRIGEFSSGVAQAQSQYNPGIAAHSAGAEIIVK